MNHDEYRCPANERLIKRFTTVEARMDPKRLLELRMPALRDQGASGVGSMEVLEAVVPT
jgi:hypothetical protein